jgi:hypothetical protein
MTFQFQILNSAHGPRFTPTVLKEARKVFKEVRMGLLYCDEELDPFKVPSFDAIEELIFFLALVGDDEFFKKEVDALEFYEGKKPQLGFALRGDREMWLSEEGKKHLGAHKIFAFTPLSYVKKHIGLFLKAEK